VTYPREILNRLKWTEGEDLAEAIVTYLHRGAPGDVMAMLGKDIVELERSFFVTKEAKIPFHRIRRIEYRGQTLFQVDEKKERGEE
jgi:hypothetical protein